MYTRKAVLLALTGLALTIGGLAGCERSIMSPPPIGWLPTEVVPADRIQVRITAGQASELANTRVVVQVGTVTLRDTTLGAATGTSVTIVFANLGLGTYQVTVTKPGQGYTLQSLSVTISDPAIPTLAFRLKKLESSSQMVVETKNVTDANVTTNIVVEQPAEVKSAATDIPPAEVAVKGVTGDVTVVTMTLNNTPSAVTATSNETVVGAVQISVPTAAPNATVTVSLPLPINFTPTQLDSAKGSKVDILRFNPTTQTWDNLGQATIGADGMATASLTGLGTDNIIAIGTTPTVSSSVRQLSTLPTISSDQLQAQKQQGQMTYTYNVDPSATAGRIARGPATKPALVEAPPGIEPAEWAIAAPIIAKQIPELKQWIQTGVPDYTLGLSLEVEEIRRARMTGSFGFTIKFNTISRTFKVKIDYTKGLVIKIIHGSGFGGAQ